MGRRASDRLEAAARTTRFDQLLEKSAIGIAMVDLEDRILKVNKGFETIFQYRNDEVVGRRINDLIVPSGLEKEADRLSRQTLEGRVVCRREGLRRRKDGAPVHVYISGYPFYADGQLAGVYGIYIDITEAKRTEEALRFRMEIEDLIATLSTRFINLPVTRIDDQIREALRQFCLFLRADRAALFQAGPEGLPREVTHEWHAEGTIPFSAARPRMPPVGTARERHGIPAPQGLCVSLASGNSQTGLLCIDSKRPRPEWTQDISPFLKLLGNVFANALDRKRHEEALCEANAQLWNATERLEMLACEDPLTGSLNRRGLQQVFTREILRAKASGRTPDMLGLLLDLDNFKRINGALGHAVGDIVLQETLRRVRSVLQPGHYAGRIGGDEVMVLLPHASPSEGMAIGERLRLAIRGMSIPHHSGDIQVTASLGLVRIPPHTKSIDEILCLTHPVLHQSKAGGKNRLSCDWLRPRGETKIEPPPVSELLAALRRGEGLRAVKQPLLRLSDEAVVGYEFLSRSVSGLFEQPDDFFRASLDADSLTLVDHRCFQTCLAASARLGGDLHRHVNIFPSTLIDVPTANLLEELPDSAPPGSFCVEISEQQIIGDPCYLVGPVRALKARNARVAIDDVGFGRTCIENLLMLEPDVLKLDKRCVTGVARDATRMSFLKRLIRMAQQLEADVVAEGIESREDLTAVKDLGVPYGQGYLWGKPA